MLDRVKETMTVESIPDYSWNIRRQFFFVVIFYFLTRKLCSELAPLLSYLIISIIV